MACFITLASVVYSMDCSRVSLMMRKLSDKSPCMIHQSRVVRASSRSGRNAGNDCIVIYHVFRCAKISCTCFEYCV